MSNPVEVQLRKNGPWISATGEADGTIRNAAGREINPIAMRIVASVEPEAKLAPKKKGAK